MELNNCFSSPTCTSITEHFGGIGSPAETLLSLTDEGIAGFARVTGQPKSQHYLPDMIPAIQTSPTEISPIQKRSQMPFVDPTSFSAFCH